MTPKHRTAVRTEIGPYPAGAYSQGISWGDLLWVSGQTPRQPDGSFDPTTPFSDQVRLALENADRVAREVGSRLSDALRITVYLVDLKSVAAFNAAYSEYFGSEGSSPLPARTTVQAQPSTGEIEIDAVIALHQSTSHPTQGNRKEIS